MNIPLVKKWYKQALHDLEMAKKNISIGGYDISAFLCQQSAEKILKTALILEGKKIPKTHYLEELAEDLNFEDEIMDLCYELTGDYMLSRYPDISEKIPYEEYTKEIAEEKIQIADNILEKVLHVFPHLREVY